MAYVKWHIQLTWLDGGSGDAWGGLNSFHGPVLPYIVSCIAHVVDGKDVPLNRELRNIIAHKPTSPVT